VTPLLLLHFGTVPLLSPVANLAAAPLVAAATSTGAVAVLAGSTWMAGLAAEMAAAVLALARVTAQWPQLGVVGVVVLGAAAALARLRPLRPWLAIGLVAFVALPVVQPHAPPQVATATFLDIGQGDATLIEDPSGVVMLVDGGRDPSLLSDELRQRRIRRIDLLVVTHGDADHAGGFEGILEAVGVGAIWVPNHPDLGPILVDLLAEAERLGVPVAVPRPGAVVDLGYVVVEVIGPRRRYQAQNDGSIVLWVEAGRTLLLAGDVGAVAQRELPDLQPDILLVPHHGSSTTDLAWLRRTVGDVAVVSVGENTYGHPSPDVIAVLIESGAAVRVTRDDGDVAVPLG
jgi:competence protein ComEC